LVVVVLLLTLKHTLNIEKGLDENILL